MLKRRWARIRTSYTVRFTLWHPPNTGSFFHCGISRGSCPSAPKIWSGNCQRRGQSTHIPVLPPHSTGTPETPHAHLYRLWDTSSGVSPESPEWGPRSVDLKTSGRGWQEPWCKTWVPLGRLSLSARFQLRHNVVSLDGDGHLLYCAKQALLPQNRKKKKNRAKVEVTLLCSF